MHDGTTEAFWFPAVMQRRDGPRVRSATHRVVEVWFGV